MVTVKVVDLLQESAFDNEAGQKGQIKAIQWFLR